MTTLVKCPACGCALRGQPSWCSLCYADLRPTRAAASTPAEPAVMETTSVAAPVAAPAADPLTAPLAVLLGDEPVGEVAAASRASWPCVACGEPNGFDVLTCVTCGAPFGGLDRTTKINPEVRRKRLFAALGALAGALGLLAVLTYALTPDVAATPDEPTTQKSCTTTIDPQTGAESSTC